MDNVFEENNKYMTTQGLKYLLSKKIMNEIEKKEEINVLASIEMGLEGRLTLMRLIVLILYIYLACTNQFNVENAFIASIIIPGVFYYIFDYLWLYKIPMFPFLLRMVKMICFKFFVDKIAMLILSLTVFNNIWIFVCYLGFAIGKFLLQFLTTFLGQKYILFLRKTEAKHNNKIGNYFLKLFD